MSSDANELLSQYLETWRNDSEGENITDTLSRIASLIERETEAYLKMNPDPFDERHPSRSKPTSTLGPLLKYLFKNDDFMNKLIDDYLMDRSDKQLQTAACRLVLDILPGIEISVVFNDTEGLIERLFDWAHEETEPIQSYATGLLAAAMDVPDIAAHNKEKNAELMPLMLKKLRRLMTENANNYTVIGDSSNNEAPIKRRRISSPSNECSNSSWAEMESFMIGTSKIDPLSNEMSQRFIFQYLSALGEYQELLCFIYEYDALSLILKTIDLNVNPDVRLAFDALKYLASLMCHKKFALDFVNSGGIQCLLKVYRQSLAANGVSMCLSCIAYHDDAMEKICFLPQHILNDLVSYALWLIEKSHDSSRSNAVIFFSLTFSYKIILELFDHQDGLRKILSEISMIDLFSNNATYTEDEIYNKRQYAKHICFALKRYYESHLIIKAQSLINSNSHSSLQTSSIARVANMPPYKPINYDFDMIMEHVEAMLVLVPIRCEWQPVDQLIKYGGAKLLIQYISMSYDWNFNGKADAIRSALDIFVVCSVLPKFQHVLSECIKIDEGQSIVGMRIVLAAAAGEIVNDAECQKSALNVIINCVCGPVNRVGGSVARISMINTKKKVYRCGEDILNKMWNCVRFNNGIMLLINLLMTKTPITDADTIRTLSCKALCGLARSESVRQVICKLQLFTNGQIQALMKEPILQDKRKEHIRFCKYCLELIERVTGSPMSSNIETSIVNLNKAEVISQTRIAFNEKELLQLIYNHLIQKGLNKTADALVEEADISFNNNANSLIKNSLKFSTPPKTVPRVSRQISILSQFAEIGGSPMITSSSNSTVSTLTNSGIPIKIHRNKNALKSTANNRRHSFHLNSSISKRKSDTPINAISLDSIVIEYLRKQHTLCKHPVVTCPTFDLFKPHRCPEPLNRRLACANITSRLLWRQIYPPFGGMYGSKMDRKFIYSRFKPVRSLRCFEQTNFLNCAFSYTNNVIYVGSETGEIHVFDYHTGEIKNTVSCYDNNIFYIEPSKDNQMILTTSYWDQTNSLLWSIQQYNLEEKMAFPHDNHVEFGKTTQDKVLGTQEYAAHLYDINSGQLVRTFEDENFSNKYSKNIATFHPGDNLLLNDGVLWDVRKEKPVHKFDKFNQSINGIFHPNGQEIISSSEIWDVKTFKLLKTVPLLDQSYIKFNDKGNVIYAVYAEEQSMEMDDKLSFSTSFRTFDGYDYSSIATIDIKKSINALAVDPNDNYIAIIESIRDSNIYSSQDNVAKVYEIGRCREEDDEERDDEDEDEDDGEESEDSYLDEELNENDDFSSSDISIISDIISDANSDEFDTENMSSDDEEDVFYQLNN